MVAEIAGWPRKWVYVLWSGFSIGQVWDVYAGMPFKEATTIAKHLQSWSQ